MEISSRSRLALTFADCVSDDGRLLPDREAAHDSIPRYRQFHSTAAARTLLHASRECVSAPENKGFCNFTGRSSAPIGAVNMADEHATDHEPLLTSRSSREGPIMTARAIAPATIVISMVSE